MAEYFKKKASGQLKEDEMLSFKRKPTQKEIKYRRRAILIEQMIEEKRRKRMKSKYFKKGKGKIKEKKKPVTPEEIWYEKQKQFI